MNTVGAVASNAVAYMKMKMVIYVYMGSSEINL
jgi:hypothetical protein